MKKVLLFLLALSGALLSQPVLAMDGQDEDYQDGRPAKRRRIDFSQPRTREEIAGDLAAQAVAAAPQNTGAVDQDGDANMLDQEPGNEGARNEGQGGTGSRFETPVVRSPYGLEILGGRFFLPIGPMFEILGYVSQDDLWKNISLVSHDFDDAVRLHYRNRELELPFQKLQAEHYGYIKKNGFREILR